MSCFLCFSLLSWFLMGSLIEIYKNVCVAGVRSAQTEPWVKGGSGFHEPDQPDTDELHSNSVWKWPVERGAGMQVSVCVCVMWVCMCKICTAFSLIALCVTYRLSDMKPNTRIIIRFGFVPYKTGKKTLVAAFDCSTFRDIKGCCTFNVKP